MGPTSLAPSRRSLPCAAHRITQSERDHHLNRTRNLLAVCTLALAGAGLIAGCGDDDGGGSDEDPAELLNEALGQDTQYDSGVVNIGIDGTLEGTTSGSVSADIGGPFNAAEGDSSSCSLTPTPPSAPRGFPGCRAARSRSTSPVASGSPTTAST